MSRLRICFVATVPFAVNVYLRAHVQYLAAMYDITIVTSGDVSQISFPLPQGVRVIPLRIERKISLVRDLVALFALVRLFRRILPDCVHSIMPKSGLLAMVAACLARIPFRCHTFTGQVWATRTGLARIFLKTMDRIAATSACLIMADSESQRSFLIKNGVVEARRIRVLADGSVAGVDIRRFSFRPEFRAEIRREYSISDDALVFIFIGRITREKGILDLLTAFEEAAGSAAGIHLMLVGQDEDGMSEAIAAASNRLPGRIHVSKFTPFPEKYFCAADVCCLPSYREGFGSVLIEAAAVGLPAIASRIYGITDAVEEGATGILHEAHDCAGIAAAILRLAKNTSVRLGMGEAARLRATTLFAESRVTRALAETYAQNIPSR